MKFSCLRSLKSRLTAAPQYPDQTDAVPPGRSRFKVLQSNAAPRTALSFLLPAHMPRFGHVSGYHGTDQPNLTTTGVMVTPTSN